MYEDKVQLGCANRVQAVCQNPTLAENIEQKINYHKQEIERAK
jgi:hypothetical protein